ncbi:MAG: heme exporter protein CcmB, partial [Mailhella sp.]|nr:heme exporter protein CcmB [Mailhella sp.]
MLKCALAVCSKDLKLTLTRGAGLVQALLLGLLLVFLFSLSLNAGDRLSPQAASAMFWLASAFCQVLIFNMLYAVEESAQARLGLLLLPAPVQAVWLGKALAG